jgi:hypothetical protein
VRDLLQLVNQLQLQELVQVALLKRVQLLLLLRFQLLELLWLQQLLDQQELQLVYRQQPIHLPAHHELPR